MAGPLSAVSRPAPPVAHRAPMQLWHCGGESRTPPARDARENPRSFCCLPCSQQSSLSARPSSCFAGTDGASPGVKQARESPRHAALRVCVKSTIPSTYTRATAVAETPGSCALAQDFGVSEAEAPQGGQGGGERALEPAPRVQGEFWNGKSEIGRARRGRSNGQNLVTSQELWASVARKGKGSPKPHHALCVAAPQVRSAELARPRCSSSPRVVCGRAPVCPFA